MDALVGLLKETLTSLPLLQVFVGGAMMLVITYLVMRGLRDRALPGVPAPAGGGVGEPAPLFAQVLHSAMDTLRDMRDSARRIEAEVGEMRRDLAAIRDQAERHTGLLEKIEREQEVGNARRRGHASG